MTGLQRRDRLWLWGMKVNALQQTEEYRGLGFAPSTMDTEQAMARTGIANVLMAGGLSLDRATLDSMPSARRIIAKNALHRHGKDAGNSAWSTTAAWPPCATPTTSPCSFGAIPRLRFPSTWPSNSAGAPMSSA